MKHILLLASLWFISCSEEFAAPMPPTVISGTANNQVIDQNTVVTLSNGDSLTVRLTLLIPNGLKGMRVEAAGIDNGNISRIDLTDNATLTSVPGDSIYTDVTIAQVVDNLEDLPFVVGSPSQTSFAITLIDAEFLTSRTSFNIERQ